MKLPSLKNLPVKKTWLVLGVALGVGLLAAFIAQRYLSNQIAEIQARDRNRQMVTLIVAKADIDKGTPLSTENVAVRQIPVDFASSGAVLPEQFERIEGQALAYAAKRGDPILWSMLAGKKAPTFSSRIEPGRRAITVPVDEINSISGMLEPGDLVDLMLTMDQRGRKVTLSLLQGVTVLATGQRVGNDAATGERRQYTTLTFDTTPGEARSVILARESGKLTALLRNPSDKAPIGHSRGDLAGLLGSGSETAIASGSAVPVLYGGRGKLPDEIPRLGSPAVPMGSEVAGPATQVLSSTTLAQGNVTARP